ncbi:MAG: glycosyltransferase [Bacteroidota bacterium]|nr:glycosyltransferase [Bacteroidota bacterium]
MKVLFIHTKYKEYGGEDSVVKNEIQLLQQNGCEVKALYFDNSRHSFLQLMMMPFNPFSYVKTIREINRFQPDVVHIHNLHFGASYSVIRAVSQTKTPMVKTLHNYRFLCPSGTLFFNNDLYLKSLAQPFPWSAIKDKVFRNSGVLTFWLSFSTWLHKKWGTFKKVDRYIVLNEQSRSLFLASDLQLQKNQLIMKPNFIQSGTTEPNALARGNHYLYIGRLSVEKGIDVLLKAFAVNGFPLTIIGDGPLRDEVLVAKAANPLITWMGYQGKEVIEEQLRRCNAVIVPSVCYEGMPLTIVEAFAAGTPVITSKLGAMQTIVTHNCNGLLFTPNNWESLNKQLQRWQGFNEAKKHEFSGHALHTYKSKYTPQKNLSSLLSIYNEAMANSKTMYVVKNHISVA